MTADNKLKVLLEVIAKLDAEEPNTGREEDREVLKVVLRAVEDYLQKRLYKRNGDRNLEYWKVLKVLEKHDMCPDIRFTTDHDEFHAGLAEVE